MRHKLNIGFTYRFILIACLLLANHTIFGWTNHFYGTYLSLEPLEEFKKQVVVESIESFLSKEGIALTEKLEEMELQARKEVPGYRPRPDALKFNPSDKKNLRNNFLRAIRVNPTIKLALYYQELPTKENLAKKSIPYTNVTIFEQDIGLKKYILTELKENSNTSALNVTSSAADEPDYGIDIDLFDKGLDENQKLSEWGKEYNLGAQAFGDPKLFYGTQAPFHMGFYHESFISYAAAGWIKNTYPEMRIFQFYHLSKFAFERGHDYWGYRFLGWALHYIGDLTQPFHSTLTPGIGTTRKMYAELFSKKKKNEYRDRVSDRHSAIEHYQFYIMRRDLSQNPNSEFLLAYKNLERDKKFKKFQFSTFVRSVVTDESNDKAGDLDDVLDDNPEIMKFKDSKDVEPTFEVTEKIKATNEFLIDLFASFGAHTRNFARLVLEK